MTIPTATASSPCVKICVIDPLSALCIGCGRTVEEISLWAEMSEPRRIEIMATLSARLGAARSRGMRGGRVRERRGEAQASRERTSWR